MVLLLLFSHSLWQGIETSTQILFENGTKQYIYIYGNLLFFLRRSSSISISMSISWRCGHDIYIHVLSCLQRPNATPIGDGSLLNPSPNNQFLASRGHVLSPSVRRSWWVSVSSFLRPTGARRIPKPLRMETNKPTPRPRRNSVFPSHQSVGSLRPSAGMGWWDHPRKMVYGYVYLFIARIW